MLGTQNTAVTTNNGSYSLFGFNNQPATNPDTDALMSDFAVNTSTTPAATPAIGLRMTGMAAGTYTVKSWHYDPATTGTIKIQVREAGAGNPQTDLLTGVSLGSKDPSTFEITIEQGKDYDLIFRADNGGLQSRFNGIEITPTQLLSISTPEIPSAGIVYPNPFQETLYLKMEKSIHYTKVVLYDITGKAITNYTNTNDDVLEMNLSNIPSGTYFLTIYNQNKIISQKTILKQ